MGAVATVVDRIEQVEAALWEAMDSRDAEAHAQVLGQAIALAGGRDHAAYCRAMQVRLVRAAETGPTGIRIAPVRIDAYLAQLWPDPTWEVTVVPFE